MKIDSICLFGYVFNEITNKWSGSAFSRIEILYGYKNFVSKFAYLVDCHATKILLFADLLKA